MRKSMQIPVMMAAALLPANPLAAQDDDGEAIVVTARRSGAPVWTVETDRGTLLLVGEITEVPKAMPWFPDRLEAATERADRVILGTKAKVSPGDVFRLIFKGGKLTKLPKGLSASHYLDQARLRRLTALEERFGEDYSRQNFLLTASDLLSKRLRFNRDTGTDATDVVRKAAKRARVPTEPVSTVRGEDILDNLFTAAPDSHSPCLDAAMAAAEADSGIVEERGIDWRASDVPAVMDNPLEQALGQCWPWSDGAFGLELRAHWNEAIDDALARPEVTLAVAPLRLLAEEDGVLDRLDRNGFELKGPAWQR